MLSDETTANDDATAGSLWYVGADHREAERSVRADRRGTPSPRPGPADARSARDAIRDRSLPQVIRRRPQSRRPARAGWQASRPGRPLGSRSGRSSPVPPPPQRSAPKRNRPSFHRRIRRHLDLHHFRAPRELPAHLVGDPGAAAANQALERTGPTDTRREPQHVRDLLRGRPFRLSPLGHPPQRARRAGRVSRYLSRNSCRIRGTAGPRKRAVTAAGPRGCLAVTSRAVRAGIVCE